jgi:hypothetical protein
MADYTERRQTVRIGVAGALIVETVAPGPPLQLTDIGMGGFCVRSAAPIKVGEIQVFRFGAPGRAWAAVFRARSAYCKPTMDDRQTPYFLTGFSFVGVTSPMAQDQLMKMMDLANPVTFS